MERRNPRSLFDEIWYRAQAAAFEGDAYDHFSSIGWRQGYDPHPLFSCAHYLAQLHDPLPPGQNPVDHYLTSDGGDARSPHVLFDPDYYVRHNGVAVGALNPLVHYLTIGGRAGFDPNPFFDASLYLETSPDVKASGLNPLVHYARSGGAEWRRPPHPAFDANGYALRCGLGPGRNPLEHFLSRLHDVRAAEFASFERPEVSVVIPNYNKSRLTLQCVVELLDAGDADLLEVIVVDNGSTASEFALLSRYLAAGVKLVRLSANRYFGEGNNLGVEASTGRNLLFLNNDAFVSQGAVRSLLDVLTTLPDAGVVGPKFVYPDGRLQECGAFVSSCGTATQRGKYLEDQAGRFTTTEPVGYVSAACLLTSRATFDRIGGFALTWDPAYYEDVDLCLKVSLLGQRSYYCANALVTHLEKATSSDVTFGLAMNSIVPINREKFVGRWGRYIERGCDPAEAGVELPAPLDPLPPQFAGNALIYTEDSFVPGGRMRYVLALARTLSQRYRTYLVTPERYSTYRLRTVAGELEMDVPRVRLLTRSAAARFAGCEVFVALGNEILPPHPPLGKRNIFVCGAVLPMTPDQVAQRWNALEGYDDVVVSSGFAARQFEAVAAGFALRAPVPAVLAPPARRNGGADAGARSATRILSIGRFTAAGNGKCQGALVDAFRRLVENAGRTDLELHFAGAVADDAASREFYHDVRRRARGLPITFHLSAPPGALRALLASASFYWHAAGFGQSEALFPERAESFSIPVVEAMSCGAIPLVYAAGGAAEVVVESETGYHWQTIEELVHKTAQLLDANPVAAEGMRRRAAIEARRYADAAFEDQFIRLLGPSWPQQPDRDERLPDLEPPVATR